MHKNFAFSGFVDISSIYDCYAYPSTFVIAAAFLLLGIRHNFQPNQHKLIILFTIIILAVILLTHPALALGVFIIYLANECYTVFDKKYKNALVLFLILVAIVALS
jgi:hypothetical protein